MARAFRNEESAAPPHGARGGAVRLRTLPDGTGEPFRHLPDLRPGDVIEVETATTTYEYVLDTAGDETLVDRAATWVRSSRPLHLRSDRLITLVTGAELSHTDDRLTVFDHLVGQHPTEH